ncbi:60S ACIDIC ribosomal protein P0 [Anaeramoeba flamelloides]|uniref:60S ACIDIC ribosomal protein P0 n=1 Tax=Anaeramoeba flamelloides TaxID=1746091 RepID=A0AAV8AJF1_9EUKA|nr:60S ACIDIC ribosomal protein P0 [Anaeramoeba flamelloides]
MSLFEELGDEVLLIFTSIDPIDFSNTWKQSNFQIVVEAIEGLVCENDIFIPRHYTNCHPEETNKFQRKNLHTRILRGKIDLIRSSDFKKQGETFDELDVDIINMLPINVYTQKIELRVVFFKQQMYNLDELVEERKIIYQKIQGSVQDIKCIGLELNYLTYPLISHHIFGEIQNIFAISVETNFETNLTRDFLHERDTLIQNPYNGNDNIPDTDPDPYTDDDIIISEDCLMF